MCENRRVAVTGIGAVTPVGNTAAETWESMKCGKNGIAPITLFNTDSMKAKLAAEVKGFDPKSYLEVNEVLRTDRYAQFAVAAVQQAVTERERSIRSGLPFFSVRESAGSVPLKKNIPSCWKKAPGAFLRCLFR